MRLKSIAAVVMAGLASAVALAGPASAATSSSPGATLTGAPRCNNGEWEVTWTLTTTGTGGADGILSKVSFTYDPPPVPPGVTYVPTLGIFAENGTIAGDGEFTAVQSLGRYHPTAVLAFTLTWHQGATAYTKSLRTDVAAPTGCPTPTPIARPPGTLLPKPTETPAGAPETPAGPAPTVTTVWTPPGKPVPTPTPTTPAAATPAPAPSTSTEAAVLAAADSGGLPRTGAAVVSIAGLAAVLIAAGLSLFVASRRRRARFTA